MVTNAEVEVADLKRDRQGRQITPRARQKEMVEAYRASGLTMGQFAQQEGINRLTLAKWSTKIRPAKPVKPGRAQFAEYRMAAPAAEWQYEVTLPNGLTVRAASAPALVELVGMMGR